MKVVALVSGGKDSCFNMLECVRHGHDIVALANLCPPSEIVEMDSFMYQTVGTDIVKLYAECMDLPLFQRVIKGAALCQSLSYDNPSGEDEVEDLYNLLKDVKTAIPDVSAVSSGAILSDYQRLRVESVCERLGLVSLAFCWRRSESELMEDIIRSGVKAILIKVAAMGLKRIHLGKSLQTLMPMLSSLHFRYGCSVCGEGGEFESLVLDCPLFRKSIVIDSYDIVTHSDDPFAPVEILVPREYHLEEKTMWGVIPALPPEHADDLYGCTLPAYPRDTALPPAPSLHEIPPGSTGEREGENTGALLQSPVSAVDGDGLEPMVSVRVCGSGSGIIFATAGGVHAGAPEAQMELLLKTLAQRLRMSSADVSPFSLPGCVIFASLFLSDMADFAAVNRVYERFFSAVPRCRDYEGKGHVCEGGVCGDESISAYNGGVENDVNITIVDGGKGCAREPGVPVSSPSRSCVQVALPEGERVRLAVVARAYPGTVPAHSRVASVPKNVMHVRSISRWAPVCIGPYSQSVLCPSVGLGFVAGQIPLCPPNMQLVSTHHKAATHAAEDTHPPERETCMESSDPMVQDDHAAADVTSVCECGALRMRDEAGTCACVATHTVRCFRHAAKVYEAASSTKATRIQSDDGIEDCTDFDDAAACVPTSQGENISLHIPVAVLDAIRILLRDLSSALVYYVEEADRRIIDNVVFDLMGLCTPSGMVSEWAPIITTAQVGCLPRNARVEVVPTVATAPTLYVDHDGSESDESGPAHSSHAMHTTFTEAIGPNTDGFGPFSTGATAGPGKDEATSSESSTVGPVLVRMCDAVVPGGAGVRVCTIRVAAAVPLCRTSIHGRVDTIKGVYACSPDFASNTPEQSHTHAVRTDTHIREHKPRLHDVPDVVGPHADDIALQERQITPSRADSRSPQCCASAFSADTLATVLVSGAFAAVDAVCKANARKKPWHLLRDLMTVRLHVADEGSDNYADAVGSAVQEALESGQRRDCIPVGNGPSSDVASEWPVCAVSVSALDLVGKPPPNGFAWTAVCEFVLCRNEP